MERNFSNDFITFHVHVYGTEIIWGVWIMSEINQILITVHWKLYLTHHMTMKYYGPLALWVGCRTQVLVAIVCESSVQYADVWQSSLNKLIKKLHDVVGIIATQHVYGLREDEKCIIFSKYCCCWNPCTCWVYDAELFTYLSPIHLASDQGGLASGS